MAGDNGDGVKLAEQIAEQIEQRIVDAGWPIGEIIGSEASLIEQFGVSRGSCGRRCGCWSTTGPRG